MLEVMERTKANVMKTLVSRRSSKTITDYWIKFFEIFPNSDTDMRYDKPCSALQILYNNSKSHVHTYFLRIRYMPRVYICTGCRHIRPKMIDQPKLALQTPNICESINYKANAVLKFRRNKLKDSDEACDHLLGSGEHKLVRAPQINRLKAQTKVHVEIGFSFLFC